MSTLGRKPVKWLEWLQWLQPFLTISTIFNHFLPLTILLTGCAGFIGSHLLDRLLANGHAVIGIDDFNDFYDPKRKRANIAQHKGNKRFILIEKDIRKLTVSDIPSSFALHSSSFLVIHLAARAGVRASIVHPFLYEQVNYAGTLHLLELMKELGIKHMIFGSSSSVYGDLNKVPFSESDENWPISPYGVTKRASELLCYAYTKLYDFNVMCLRFFTVYGPRNRPDMAAYSFMKAIDEGKEIKLYGKQTSRDFTYVDDIVDGIVRSMKHIMASDRGFNVINLGNSSPVTVLKFVQTLEKVVGKRALLSFQSLPPGDMAKTYADIAKARKILDWKPGTPLGQGLKKLWNWYRVSAKH